VRARPIMFGWLLLTAVGFVHTDFGLPPPSNSPELLYTVAKRYEALAWIRGADRFSSDAIIFLQDASGRRPLIPSFAASADPTVSFDGKRALFAGKQKTQDPWQIWEVARDSALTGGAARHVTSCGSWDSGKGHFRSGLVFMRRSRTLRPPARRSPIPWLRRKP